MRVEVVFSADASPEIVEAPSPTTSEMSETLSEAQKSDFWFKDGNVVLMTGTVAFKVHKGNLERHSDVFRDLLSIPQPDNAAMLEDCPIIELHDSPMDLWHLLRAIYDGLYFKQLAASDFRPISSVLRLSTKYFIEHLRERCVSRLTIDWPSSLSAWDSREFEATDVFGRYNPRARFAHPILVINFAREMRLNHVLPCAFYDLCRYGPSKVVSGVVRTQLNEQGRPISPGPDGEIPAITLSYTDVHTALVGRERAQRAVASFIEDELSSREVAIDCHNRDRDGGRVCREAYYYIMLNLLRSISGLASGRDCDPLFTLAQAGEMLHRTDFTDGTQFCSLKICAACKLDFAHAVKAARERVWSQVPTWFGMRGFDGEPSEEPLS